MQADRTEKRGVTPEHAVKILKSHGTIVTIEEAKIILDFMYKIGKLSVEQYVKISYPTDSKLLKHFFK